MAKDKRALTSAANGAKSAGRPPQSMTIRVGDGVAVRYGRNAPMELGKITEIYRGRPRTAVAELQSGVMVWLMVETPKD